MLAAASGLVAGLSLIVAIGAQNAFVLRQGLRREHVPVVVLVCAASDALLIAVGVAGLDVLVARAPALLEVLRWGGVVFLLGYGARAAVRALRGSPVADSESATAPDRGGAVPVALTALALTWLNPHVYLDTVLLLGSMAAGRGDARWWFGAGAITASMLWFTALGFGARLLAPLFRRRRAWQVLDGVIALVMVTLALQLALG